MGRKAATLGWAEVEGLRTPGGFVVPAECFWSALGACGVAAQARYLESAVLRLDPVHAVGIAASIADAMDPTVLQALAAPDAVEAFSLLDAPLVVCRSSAAMEDGSAAAFPGVFTSVLHIECADDLARAMAACWQSAFSADVIHYLLRVQAEPVDFSLALLVQAQVEGAWYGVYASADPVTGVAEPVVDVTPDSPDAVVGGARPAVHARRAGGRWHGIDDFPALATSLEAVHGVATRLGAHLACDVDLEFAVPHGGDEPVVLQSRPLTRTGRRVSDDLRRADLRGRPCAGGRVAGRAGGPGGSSEIAVVERLTTADYGVVMGYAGVVMEHDVSPLCHVAMLCRELGVALVCGVDSARAMLDGRLVEIDGSTGGVAFLDEPPDGARPRSGSQAVPAIPAVEVLLRLLAEGRPGRSPAAEAERILRRLVRAFGSEAVDVLPSPVDRAELERLQAFAASVLGPQFSVPDFLAGVASYRRGHVPEHHTPPGPRAPGDG